MSAHGTRVVELPDRLRNTDYAEEIARVAIQWASDPTATARLERLKIHALGDAEEVRFSWWPDGRMAQRPLDCSEEDLILLLAEGIRKGVLSPRFLSRLLVAVAE